MIIFGSSVFQRTDGLDLYKLANKVSSLFINKEKKWNGFNILHRDVGRVAALEVGLNSINISQKKPKFVFILGADNIIT